MRPKFLAFVQSGVGVRLRLIRPTRLFWQKNILGVSHYPCGRARRLAAHSLLLFSLHVFSIPLIVCLDEEPEGVGEEARECWQQVWPFFSIAPLLKSLLMFVDNAFHLDPHDFSIHRDVIGYALFPNALLGGGV